VLTDQTVLVRGDRIVAIGPTATVAVRLARPASTVEANFLIPGLAACIAHLGMRTFLMPED